MALFVYPKFTDAILRDPKETGLSHIYSLVFGPTSSMVHGMYDSLERYYLRRCLNPFHCLHRVPFYWSKNSISEYGPRNALVLADWVFVGMLTDVGEDPSTPMPGQNFFDRLDDGKAFEAFCDNPEHASRAKANENFVSEVGGEMMAENASTQMRDGIDIGRDNPRPRQVKRRPNRNA